MAPRTRSTRKRATNLVPSGPDTRTFLNTELFKKTLQNTGNKYGEKADVIIAELLNNVDKLANEHASRKFSEEILKDLIQMNYPVFPVRTPVVQVKCETIIEVDEVSMKSDKKHSLEKTTPSRRSLTTSSLSMEASDVVAMEIDEDSNGTEQIFSSDKEILSLTDEELIDTAISDTTSRLEEMSMNEEIEMEIPLHTSTPLKKDFIDTAVLHTDQNNSTSRKSEVKSEKKDTPIFTPDHYETKPVPVFESMEKEKSINVTSSRTPSTSRSQRNLQIPKTEGRPVFANVSPLTVNSVSLKVKYLQTQKQETPITDHAIEDKLKHASYLREKFLNEKQEKARKDNEKRMAVLERKRAQEEEMKSGSYKSPSRNKKNLPSSTSKSTKKLTPGPGPSKKTRIEVLTKNENKPSVTIATIAKSPSKKLPRTPFKTAKASYEMTPDRTYHKNSANDYGVDDLHSDNETDDESAPRKAIPAWADWDVVRENVCEHIRNPQFDIESFFGPIEKPNLIEIFRNGLNSKKRGSSANWKN